MPPKKKKLKPPEGQTQLSFAKRPKVSKHQEQEGATAIHVDKDDAKGNEDNEESAQAKSNE